MQLHEAISKNDVAGVRRMLARRFFRPDVNALDDSGQTPLHAAANNGESELADILLSNGADVNACDASGRTTRCTLDAWPDLVVVDVSDDQDGQAWSVASNVNGQLILLNVPPYLSPSPDELLIPKRYRTESKE